MQPSKGLHNHVVKIVVPYWGAVLLLFSAELVQELQYSLTEKNAWGGGGALVKGGLPVRFCVPACRTKSWSRVRISARDPGGTLR
jgi:hypothetical protein